MDELLKEQAREKPMIQDRKLARSMTPETNDLIKSVLESRNFFEEDFPEEEDIVTEDKFSAKTVSTSKHNLSTKTVQN